MPQHPINIPLLRNFAWSRIFLRKTAFGSGVFFAVPNKTATPPHLSLRFLKGLIETLAKTTKILYSPNQNSSHSAAQTLQKQKTAANFSFHDCLYYIFIKLHKSRQNIFEKTEYKNHYQSRYSGNKTTY